MDLFWYFALDGPAGKAVDAEIDRGESRGAATLRRNLRKDSYEPELVAAYLETADVVKVNEEEAVRLGDWFGLAKDPAAFCREAAGRYECRGVCVTLGPRGCCLLVDGRLVEAPGYAVAVADTVGRAMLSRRGCFTESIRVGRWSASPISRIEWGLWWGRNGALPAWRLEELDALG